MNPDNKEYKKLMVDTLQSMLGVVADKWDKNKKGSTPEDQFYFMAALMSGFVINGVVGMAKSIENKDGSNVDDQEILEMVIKNIRQSYVESKLH